MKGKGEGGEGGGREGRRERETRKEKGGMGKGWEVQLEVPSPIGEAQEPLSAKRLRIVFLPIFLLIFLGSPFFKILLSM